ncbi:replication protein RepA [Salmonella enterica subsp. enterica serovar Montevideo]|uniref:Replication protein RepA n=2 Tax=Salmonella enterica TaxID=28901 RepID=A0A3Z6QNP0_SALEB|nr:replication protein RepA [Salmonella enterica]EAB6034542.1 replication protein RepA [Salmonella enterica subsp. enterica serovar Java]EBS1128243.1 replication protein RepA [Salmonella enterica subsp. enterica serovar Montevideo]EBV8394973.1 replication protein RepA [Salmonella enterica subsp. enterica serovar Virchow]EBW9897286.1 replication protein RepA [Salmonella enterica subsp. enterica serovar Panama]ECA0405654.1 replication protein RepA [Salmonella enterica subsp. enterica serovar New
MKIIGVFVFWFQVDTSQNQIPVNLRHDQPKIL